MKKKLLVTGIALGMILNSYAGGLLTNTNQNVTFLRNPARDASTEIDAAYTNPAGLAFLNKDGFFFSLNNQSAFQTRTITSDFAPFANWGGSSVKEFEGKTTAPVIPNLQAAYKTGKWAISANIGVVGGGGTLDFSDGIPSFESQVAGNIATLSSAAGIPTTYTLDSRVKGTQIIYGVQLGATYKINDYLSAYIGGRASIVNNSYDGYLRNVQFSAKDNLTTYFTTVAGTARYVANSLQPAVGMGFGDAKLSQLVAYGMLPQAQLDQMAAGLKITSAEAGALSVNEAIGTFNGVAQQADGAVAGINQLSALDIQLNCKQSGFGVAPIVGFDFNFAGLNIGVKYEFKTVINLKNKTTAFPDGMEGLDAFKDGTSVPFDVPALLAIGAKYDIIKPLTISVGYHRFFDSNARMVDANNEYKQQNINGGVNEYLAGLEYRINKMFLVSCGTQITHPGLKDAYFSDLSFDVNSVSFGFGGAIDITKNIRVNLAYLFTNYSDRNVPLSSSMPGDNTYTRTNKAFGIGVDLRF